MIPEKMLEFLCIEQVLKSVDEDDLRDYIYGKTKTVHIVGDTNRRLDINHIIDRKIELLNELTEPYVIDSNSKE